MRIWLFEQPLLKDKPVDFAVKQFRLRGLFSSELRHLFEFGAVGLLLMIAWIAQIGCGLTRHASDLRVGLLALGGANVLGFFAFDYLLCSRVEWGAGVFMSVCYLVVAAVLRNNWYGE